MCLHTLIQAKGLIRKSMTRSIIMLNIIVENEENYLFNILISFPRSWSQILYQYIAYCGYYLRRVTNMLVKMLFLLSIVILIMMRLLVVLQVTAGKTMIKVSRKTK